MKRLRQSKGWKARTDPSGRLSFEAFRLKHSPGGTVWASIAHEPTQQSLLDSWKDGATCVALNQDSSGYFLRQSDGDWRYRNIPTGLQDLIDRKLGEGTDPVYVALGTDRRYFATFDDGTFYSSNNAGAYFDAAAGIYTRTGLRPIYKGRQSPPRMAAFGPNQGWWVLREDGSSQWDNLPDDLEKELSDAAYSASFVSVSPDGSWFAIIDGEYAYSVWSDDLHETVREEQAKNRDVSRIHFGYGDDGDGDWFADFIFSDEDWVAKFIDK